MEVCELLADKFDVPEEKLSPFLMLNSKENIEKIIIENSIERVISNSEPMKGEGQNG